MGSVSVSNETKNTVYSLGFTPPVNVTNVVTGVNGVATMASQIFPERFTDGNVGVWLKHCERCAAANAWDAPTRVRMLPAFFQGPTATYFESLTASLKACFCPDVNHEW